MTESGRAAPGTAGADIGRAEADFPYTHLINTFVVNELIDRRLCFMCNEVHAAQVSDAELSFLRRRGSQVFAYVSLS